MGTAKKYHFSLAMSTGVKYVEEFQKVRIRSRIYDNDRKAGCSVVCRTGFTGEADGNDKSASPPGRKTGYPLKYL
jgi:hypothetical protein